MIIIDRVRLRVAVARYDFWLDFRGVPAAARRTLREELRANLLEAAEHTDATRAVLALGSLRAMAYDVADSYADRPRWTFGAYLASATFLALLAAWTFSVTGFVAGAHASGVTDRPVTGALAPWGGEVAVELGGGGGFEVSAVVPWTLVLVVGLVFLLAARPWRPFTHRRREAPVRA